MNYFLDLETLQLFVTESVDPITRLTSGSKVYYYTAGEVNGFVNAGQWLDATKYFETFNAYKIALEQYNQVFDTNHPIAQFYICGVEQYFHIKLNDDQISQLLILNELPVSLTIQGYRNNLISHLSSEYKLALHNEAVRKQAMMYKAKAKLFELQGSIPLEYFVGDNQLFIHCELSHNFRSVHHKVDTAFRQLLKIGKPQMWQVNNYINNPLAYAVSYPVAPDKLEIFYACYYSFLFEAYKPDDCSLEHWLTISYHIEDWNNGIKWQSRGDFEDITSNYFYIA